MFRIVAALWRPIGPAFRYNPITAADEKIPLSVEHVNNKPQHLVFCWHFAHLLSKHRHLPVESSKRPCLERFCAVCFAPKSGQARLQAKVAARFPYHPPRVDLSRPPHKAQNQCRMPPRLCELWTNRAGTGGPSYEQPVVKFRPLSIRRLALKEHEFTRAVKPQETARLQPLSDGLPGNRPPPQAAIALSRKLASQLHCHLERSPPRSAPADSRKTCGCSLQRMPRTSDSPH